MRLSTSRHRLFAFAFVVNCSIVAASFASAAVPNLQANGDDYSAGGFYALYAENRREGIANFISEDFLLQGYSMLRARQLRTLEREQLLPALEQTVAALANAMGSAQPARYSTRTQAYVQVLQSLLSGSDTALIHDDAQAELQLIRQASGLAQSPLWAYTLDYSQFKARAHYENSDPDLQRYFVASRYANSVLFPVVASRATGISAVQAEQFAQQAQELSILLSRPDVASHYQVLTDALDWQFGAADDLTVEDVRSVLAKPRENYADALRDYAQASGKVPTVLSLPLQVDALEAGLSARQAQIGWRLLPARRSADAQAMQQIVTNKQNTLRWPCSDCDQPPLASAMGGDWYKAYPSYIELMALQGSTAAKAKLKQLGLEQYSAYQNQLQLASDAYANLEGLQGAQLPVWRAALAGADSTQALHSGGGFWLWQRSLALLYQKQSATPFSKSIALEQANRPGAVLANNTTLYRALLILSGKHEERDTSQAWRDYSALLKRCVDISDAQDKGVELSSDDGVFLNDLDRQLQVLTGRDDATIVVDLHSNYQDKQVLQLALAYPKVDHRGVARGARFNVQEFTQPLDQRLDNQAWRQMLQGQIK